MPLARGTGFFPILLMTYLQTLPFGKPLNLANRAEQLAADLLFAGLAVAHPALGRADYAVGHAVEDGGELLELGVDAAGGLGAAVDRVDDLGAVHGVLQLDAKHALAGVLDQVEVVDVPFGLQHAGNAGADLAVGD